MPALNEQMNRESHIDRLVNQRDALARHMADLERQLVDVAQHHAAVNETIARLRGGVRVPKIRGKGFM